MRRMMEDILVMRDLAVGSRKMDVAEKALEFSPYGPATFLGPVHVSLCTRRALNLCIWTIYHDHPGGDRGDKQCDDCERMTHCEW